MSHILSWGYRKDEEGMKKWATPAAFERLMMLQHASFLCSCIGSNKLLSLFHCIFKLGSPGLKSGSVLLFYSMKN